MQNLGVNGIDAAGRIDDADALGLTARFPQKAVADSGEVFVAAGFHAIRSMLTPLGGEVERQVENNGHVGFEAAGRESADLPQRLDIESPRVTLIDDIGEPVIVTEDLRPGHKDSLA